MGLPSCKGLPQVQFILIKGFVFTNGRTLIQGPLIGSIQLYQMLSLHQSTHPQCKGLTIAQISLITGFIFNNRLILNVTNMLALNIRTSLKLKSVLSLA